LHRTRFSLSTLPLILLVGLLALPVLALLASWLPWGVVQADTGAILREMASTVLPDYVWTTLWLGLMGGGGRGRGGHGHGGGGHAVRVSGPARL
jgi:iron(III) transport system permease protein